MYIFKKSTVLTDMGWEDTNISGYSMKSLLDFKRVIVELENLQSHFLWDSNDYYQQLTTFNGTFNEFLNSLGNVILKVTPGKLEDHPINIVMSRLLNPTHGLYISDHRLLGNFDTIVQPTDARDLFIKSMSPTEAKNYLFSVNGYVHPTEMTTTGVFIKDANVSLQMSGRHTASIIDFTSVGGINQIPLTRSMIKKIESTETDYRITLELNSPLPKGNVFLVLGGILNIENSIYKVLSNSIIVLTLNRFSLLRQLTLSNQYWGSLDLFNPEGKGIDSVTINTVQKLIESIMTFLVVTKQPVSIKTNPLDSTGLPGRNRLTLNNLGIHKTVNHTLIDAVINQGLLYGPKPDNTNYRLITKSITDNESLVDSQLNISKHKTYYEGYTTTISNRFLTL